MVGSIRTRRVVRLFCVHNCGILNFVTAHRDRAKKVTQRDEQYPGPSAFSEAESRALRDVATSFRPSLYINVHSGIKEMYMGWDHKVGESDVRSIDFIILHSTRPSM